MAEGRTLRQLRVSPHHPRRPEPSRIELMLMPTDRKTDRVDVYTITETQALELAEQAMTSVRILRDLRQSMHEFDRIELIDRIKILAQSDPAVNFALPEILKVLDAS